MNIEGHINIIEQECRSLRKRMKKIQPGQWIPCSERLPKHDVTVLVWLYENYYLAELRLIDRVLCWAFDEFDLSDDEFDDVIAWMPLPEPYQEVSDESQIQTDA